MRQRLSHHVNGQRLWDRLMLLANYGARADGGVDRPALSDVEAEARAQLIGWGRELGLQPFTDPIANLFLRLEGSRPDLSPVLIGSHIDSQPTGGKFDGAFGVLAALEVIEAIRASGEQPLRSIEVVAWTNEEGSRFAPGMSGSEAFAGVKPLETLLAVTDAAGCTVREAAERVLARDVDVPQRPFGWRPAAFVEAHIEQAPLLERAGVPIGVVTGIQGTRRYRVRVRGEAAHAGTTLRAERKDALMAAVRMIRAIDAVASDPADVMLTVGMMRLTPNAPSVVPEEAYFSIDLRHVDDAVVDRIDAEIRRIVADECGPCSATLDQIAHAPSLDFAPQIRAAITTAAEAAELPAMPIYSAAGHDARQLHYICPTGMIFIPCRGGISHNPAEWAEPDHVTAGARVLADVTMALASQGDEGAGRA
ncbi:M20 family metallo-hydrolase [Rhodopseudomonas palustris]|uniref:Zn-dependent hydrolase n=1 Tax=Rhodopseudomonas palustris TaxID=1076 RepID=A0A418V0Z0_RHOPL|nr:M20 family metallo-hydrolase [Rhodopseudomonas palustris]RJF69503.1 Zn-dependent hydrolase [Rhodopseudomonas palustris]